MNCLTCNYDLTQLTEHRCPECGREFDPKDARSFISEAWYESQTAKIERWILWLAFFPAMAIGVMIFLIALSVNDRTEHTILAPMASAVGFILLIAIPASVVTTIILLIVNLSRVWRGGRTMRLRIVKQAALVVGIWLASIFGMGCLVSSIVG